MKIGTKVKLKTGEDVTLIEFYKIFLQELFDDGTSLGIDELMYELINDTQESREGIKKELLKDLKREINLIKLIKTVEE